MSCLGDVRRLAFGLHALDVLFDGAADAFIGWRVFAESRCCVAEGDQELDFWSVGELFYLADFMVMLYN